MDRFRPGLLVLLAAVGLTGCESPEPTGAGKDYSKEWVLQGKRVYERHCAGCHGARGDGKGPAARFLDPKPRNFVRATYKFRSTPSGDLPTDADLMRTLTTGVHNTSMPSWKLLSDAERTALVEYIKTFSDRFTDEDEVRIALPLPGAPEEIAEEDEDWIEAGALLYSQMQCASCHGIDGSGRGATATDLEDNEGNPIRPLDFSRRTPKGGSAPEDYYRAFTTGIDGTPMPSYQTSLSDEQRWHLVAFVMALRKYEGKVPPEFLPDDLKPEGAP